jgi:hypothetical protein
MKRLGLLLLIICTVSIAVDSQAALYAPYKDVVKITDLNTTLPSVTFDVTFTQFMGDTTWKAGIWNDTTSTIDYFTLNAQGQGTVTLSSLPADGIIDFAISEFNGSNPLKLSDKGYEVLFSGPLGGGLYDAIQINWGFIDSGFKFEANNAKNQDSAFSQVPIPATALLFCSSILGIVGIRRKISK